MTHIETFRPWQVEAFLKCKDERYVVLKAPGGSGKSLAQVMLAQDDIERNMSKQLIAVPQNHIHHSFLGDASIVFVLPGTSQPSQWEIGHNLCDSDQAGKRLKAFLLADPASLANLAAITTHTCLAQVWQTLTEDEKWLALNCVSYRIDEAHHISNVFHEDELALYNVKDRAAIIADATRLGMFVRDLTLADEPTCKLHLTTATFFRGDQKTIISEAVRDSFTYFSLPWDEYYSTLGIECLEFNFVAYHDDPIHEVVSAISEEPEERHLVIIPALTTRYRKNDTLNRLMAALTKSVPAKNVLDLVTSSTQESHKKLLQTHPNDFAVVVACRLFDEGTDWVPCTRLHNTDAGESSLTLAVQRFFRPLRKHPKKKHVRIDNYVPAFLPDIEMEEQRRILSDRCNAVLAATITQGELMPVFIPLKADTAEGKARRVTLQDIYGDKLPVALKNLIREYEAVENKSDHVAVAGVVEKVLEAHGCPDECKPEDVRAAWLAQLHRLTAKVTKASNRESMEVKAFDASEIRENGFDIVWMRQPRGSCLVWGTENIDSVSIRRLLRTIRSIPSLEEIRDGLKAQVERTGTRTMMSGEGKENVSGWCDELGRSATTVNNICKNHYATSASEQMDVSFKTTDAEFRDTLHSVIQEYDRRGVELCVRRGPAGDMFIPELGMTAHAVDSRLSVRFGTTLAKEREKALEAKALTADNVRRVIREYRDRGVFVTSRIGRIPELNTTAKQLATWFLSRGENIRDVVTSIWEEKEGLFITRAEVCDRIGISMATLVNWTRDGKIEHIRIGDRGTLYRLSDIERIARRDQGYVTSSEHELRLRLAVPARAVDGEPRV
jgi:hypothetical protein